MSSKMARPKKSVSPTTLLSGQLALPRNTSSLSLSIFGAAGILGTTLLIGDFTERELDQ